MGQAPNAPSGRLISLDAYRGFIMLVMASAGLGIPQAMLHWHAAQLRPLALLASSPGLAFPAGLSWAGLHAAGSETAASPIHPAWDFLAHELEHAAWSGCSFWDLIQPSFMFMVGVAVPYSYASRRARGESRAQIAQHVLRRALILVLLGIFLTSNGKPHTDFTFDNVLVQIGLGYAFLYLVLDRGFAVQLLVATALLGGYWFLFYRHPLPGPGFDRASVGVGPFDEWFSGLFAHWNKNANFAADVDRWFLSLFPYSSSYPYNRGGYQTLNFVPSLATMIFGLMAGEWLRSPRRPGTKLALLVLAGVLGLLVGWGLGETVCPIVKRIWTPSWAIYSAGWTFLMLAAFYAVLDLGGCRAWAFPLVVVGMNSIAMYCMSQLLKPWIRQTLQTHVSRHLFEGPYGPIVAASSVLVVLWLFCLGLYRQRIFVRI